MWIRGGATPISEIISLQQVLYPDIFLLRYNSATLYICSAKFRNAISLQRENSATILHGVDRQTKLQSSNERHRKGNDDTQKTL